MRAYIKGAFFYFVALTLPVALLLNLFITLLSDKIIKVSFLAPGGMDPAGLLPFSRPDPDANCVKILQINFEFDLSQAVFHGVLD